MPASVEVEWCRITMPYMSAETGSRFNTCCTSWWYALRLVPELVEEALLGNLVPALTVLRFRFSELALALTFGFGEAVPVRLLPGGRICLLGAVV